MDTYPPYAPTRCYRCPAPCQKAPEGQMSVCDECRARGWHDGKALAPQYLESRGSVMELAEQYQRQLTGDFYSTFFKKNPYGSNY